MWLVVSTINFYTRLTLTRAPSGVGESAPGPGVSWGGNSGCHLAQPHICGHATIPCPTIYVDTQPPPSPPPYYPFNARPTVLLPSPCALVAKGLNCLRLVINMIMAVVMMMAMITIVMTSVITWVGSPYGGNISCLLFLEHTVLAALRKIMSLSWRLQWRWDWWTSSSSWSMIMIITIMLWALFSRGWQAPWRLPPYGEPTPGQLFHTLPNNLLFLSAFHWLLDGLQKQKQINFVSFLVLLTIFRIGFNTFCGMLHWVIFFLQIFILLKRIAFHML